MVKCRFCANEPFTHGGSNDRDDPRTVDCPRCGKFCASPRIWDALEDAQLDGVVIGGWIHEQNSAGIVPIINSEDIQRLRAFRKPGLKERAERYLIAAADRCRTLQTPFKSTQKDLIGISYSKDEEETGILVQYLIENGWLSDGGTDAHRVTPTGHIAADELRTRRAKSSQGFVAMWFDPNMNPIYNDGLSVGVERAGFKSMRVDKKDHANRSDDEIIAEIRRSAFLVADFTGHNGGVYFEAGFAMGLGLRVIWTCKKDGIKDLHFDIRQYNCIDWSEADDLATRLHHRIEAMLGHGPLSDHQQVRSTPA